MSDPPMSNLPPDFCLLHIPRANTIPSNAISYISGIQLSSLISSGGHSSESKDQRTVDQNMNTADALYHQLKNDFRDSDVLHETIRGGGEVCTISVRSILEMKVKSWLSRKFKSEISWIGKDKSSFKQVRSPGGSFSEVQFWFHILKDQIILEFSGFYFVKRPNKSETVT